MSGICGYLHPDADYQVERDLLGRMNATLRHRGPDSQGYYLDKNIGMAMRRLAIIDLDGGEQPVCNGEGTLALILDGEIYNFRELQSELENLGYSFRTSSDAEVVLHAYEEWGDDALLRFNGMFAFSLWDAKSRRLLLARDRMGVKPLFWMYSHQGLLWASEAKAILVAPWVERYINPQALHHYLSLQYTPNPLTIFEGIYQLPAAYKLVIEPGGSPRVERWWRPSFLPKLPDDEKEIIAEARRLLLEAVKRSSTSDVPVGAFLGGGMDSSILLALLAELSPAPVKTFSIVIEGQQLGESHSPQEVAGRYQTDHHDFIFSSQDLADLIEHVISSTDEPFANPDALLLYELARQSSQYISVALCPAGSDETLAGYQRYALDRRFQFYTAMPGWLTRHFIPSTMSLLPELGGAPEGRNLVAGMKRFGQASAITHKASSLRWGSYFTHEDKLHMYANGWHQDITHIHTADWISQYFDDASAASLLDRTLYADQSTYLPGSVLPKVDRMTMAHSLEARMPFLDADWVEWTARLPERYKLRGMHTKWLLREAFSDRIPSPVTAPDDQGFEVPVGSWLSKELRQWARERLTSNPDFDQWITPRVTRQLLDEQDSGRRNHGRRLWTLLMFEIWLELYL